MMSGLINGMNAQKATAVSTARSIATAINEEYAKVQKIGSPSKIWDKFGYWQDYALVNRMKKDIPTIEQTTEDVALAAMPYSSYTPENSYVSSSSSSNEYNSYAPQFVLNFNGDTDNRGRRRVQSWVKEAMQEFIDSVDRKNPQVQEV